ncbi:hypothetical protein L1049_026044 [Liquidambar formosana]|uniref:Uncharacterized protein n=1 Tax=Liquidambar formosana TaxID=63359 RepID=A0AAP0R6X5_LIQFO
MPSPLSIDNDGLARSTGSGARSERPIHLKKPRSTGRSTFGSSRLGVEGERREEKRREEKRVESDCSRVSRESIAKGPAIVASLFIVADCCYSQQGHLGSSFATQKKKKTAIRIKSSDVLDPHPLLWHHQHAVTTVATDPARQQALSHEQHGKWAEEVLDGSQRLLDVCGTARDVLLHLTENSRELEASLRRRGRESGIANEVGPFMSQEKGQ